MNATPDELKEAESNPVISSQCKWVGLRALAHQLKIPQSDIGYLAVVVAQSAQHNQKGFMEMVAHLMTAPPYIQSVMVKLMEPLQKINEKITDEQMEKVVMDTQSESLRHFVIISLHECGSLDPDCRSSGDG